MAVWWLTLFIICFVAAAYGLFGLAILVGAGSRWLWRLLPEPRHDPAPLPKLTGRMGEGAQNPFK
jgi:hypothetical protein